MSNQIEHGRKAGDSSPTELLQLSTVRAGMSVRIKQLSSSPEVSVRLRELGFCENAIVRCVHKGGGNIICEVCNTRIGLNQRIADSIYVLAHNELSPLPS